MKPFDLKQVIQDYATKEADEKWAHTKDKPNFPIYKKCENIKNNLGWRNFLRQLKP
jgi:hypothetical protein